ncbi:hypothetical protein TWF481_002791 [Arthrobotrys musiformis]|uniref:Uncharacterized protein n=1 Tax=Arthrobotrys musiformis TaxID=47236 RepID=A0AAV9VRD5_9PEZI
MDQSEHQQLVLPLGISSGSTIGTVTEGDGEPTRLAYLESDRELSDREFHDQSSDGIWPPTSKGFFTPYKKTPQGMPRPSLP